TVTDPTGGPIAGAEVTVQGPGGNKATHTNDSGHYALPGLVPGTYAVTITKDGFAPYGDGSVAAVAGRTTTVDVPLTTRREETVKVESTAPPVSLDPNNNAGAIVISGKDLDALPDDPDELSDALQALAGPSAGPNGGQLFIDGFTGGRMPPKSAIREIRI